MGTLSKLELEFGNVVSFFLGEGATGVPGEKPPGEERRTDNKLNPHMTPGLGIEWDLLVEGECSHHCPIPAPCSMQRQ